jgi:galactofuranosylgalactofuranosylrhamnosyl-N-acetylglucosaminyl-diphospho-decaprenol beta-1,5/1,6-galactofuranosyltransferase
VSSAGDGKWRSIQRVVLPADGQADTMPLYVDAGSVSGFRLIENDEWARKSKKRDEKLALVGSVQTDAHIEDVRSRRSIFVREGAQLSFGTYFNGFPASYWRRWTTLSSIRLSVKTAGQGSVLVYKSSARGTVQRVESRKVNDDSTVVFDLPLTPFGDGGWYWFDLLATTGGLTLESAEWLTDVEPSRAGDVTLQITTMDKPGYCLDNIAILGADEDLLEEIKEVLIVDQGTRKVASDPDFEPIARNMRGKLRIIDQSNLGGSGGFARGMFEALKNSSDYVLLMDDDVVIEPEGVRRLTTFAGYCKKPTLVGGHMFDLHNRTVLETYGEVIDPYHMHWEPPHADMETRHDFSLTNLRLTRWAHRRVDVDYNAWWMCLIPTAVIREVGLGLPLFIKWDDVEFGIRAKEAGYNTVSLPGAAVWHVSWGEKDDMVGWQSYFHERNRIIAALLHSPFKHGGKLLVESLKLDVMRLISMQYYTEHLRLMAAEDVFKGPRALSGNLSRKIVEVNALKSKFSDADFRADVDSFPAPRLGSALQGAQAASPPARKKLVPWAIKTIARMLLRKTDPSAQERPEAILAHRDNRWWMLARYDSVIVSNAEGNGASWYRRDRGRLVSMLLRAFTTKFRLYRNWVMLAEQYRSELKNLSSEASWRSIFTEHTVRDTKYE